MRDKVLAAIALYAEGGSIGQHLDTIGLSRADFYGHKRKNPELQALYLEVQEARADMMVDEAYLLGTDKDLNPQVARVQAEIRLKIAAAFDRRRFGERVQLDTEIKVSLTQAIEEGRRRALRPPCDPATILDAEYTMITDASTPKASDKQSEQPKKAGDPPMLDPFE